LHAAAHIAAAACPVSSLAVPVAYGVASQSAARRRTRRRAHRRVNVAVLSEQDTPRHRDMLKAAR